MNILLYKLYNKPTDLILLHILQNANIFWINSGCQAVSETALQGVCYTKEQCEDIGGSADGNCAAGFGVCCIVT